MWTLENEDTTYLVGIALVQKADQEIKSGHLDSICIGVQNTQILLYTKTFT